MDSPSPGPAPTMTAVLRAGLGMTAASCAVRLIRGFPRLKADDSRSRGLPRLLYDGSMPARSRPLRSDAARNRDKLLDAAALEFGERGLDAPLEHIARRAGVSIGTLYAPFPAREAFFEAMYPPRLAALDQIAAKALADVDPWNGFAGFIEGLFGLLAADRRFS